MKTIIKLIVTFFAFLSVFESKAQMPIEKQIKKSNNAIFKTFINADINDKAKIKTNNFKAFKNLRDTGCICLPDSIYISYYTQLNGVQRFTYNLDGNITNVLNQDWNGSGPVWKNNTFYTLSYDGNGNMLNKLQQIWNSAASIWVNSTQEIYNYDSLGKITSNLPQSWDSATSSWVNYQRYINFTWDANDNNLGYIHQFWNDTSFVWENRLQYIYSYDANGNNLINLTQKWVDSLSTWVNYRQNVYTWDNHGNNTSFAEQWWGGTLWFTGYHSTQTNTYDTDGYLISMLYQYWAGTPNPTIQYQYTFTYDVNGKLINSLALSLNGSTWVNSHQTTFTYDLNGNETNYLSQNWYNNSWENILLNTHSYDTCGNLLTETRKQGNGPLEINQYFYPLTCTSVYQGTTKLSSSFELNLYPNPAHEEIIIENKDLITGKILINNALGELLYQTSSQNANRQVIDVSMLDNGVYFIYFISTDGVIRVKKFVKG